MTHTWPHGTVEPVPGFLGGKMALGMRSGEGTNRNINVIILRSFLGQFYQVRDSDI